MTTTLRPETSWNGTVRRAGSQGRVQLLAARAGDLVDRPLSIGADGPLDTWLGLVVDANKDHAADGVGHGRDGFDQAGGVLVLELSVRLSTWSGRAARARMRSIVRSAAEAESKEFVIPSWSIKRRTLIPNYRGGRGSPGGAVHVRDGSISWGSRGVARAALPCLRAGRMARV